MSEYQSPISSTLDLDVIQVAVDNAVFDFLVRQRDETVEARKGDRDIWRTAKELAHRRDLSPLPSSTDQLDARQLRQAQEVDALMYSLWTDVGRHQVAPGIEQLGLPSSPGNEDLVRDVKGSVDELVMLGIIKGAFNEVSGGPYELAEETLEARIAEQLETLRKELDELGKVAMPEARLELARDVYKELQALGAEDKRAQHLTDMALAVVLDPEAFGLEAPPTIADINGGAVRVTGIAERVDQSLFPWGEGQAELEVLLTAALITADMSPAGPKSPVRRAASRVLPGPDTTRRKNGVRNQLAVSIATSRQWVVRLRDLDLGKEPNAGSRELTGAALRLITLALTTDGALDAAGRANPTASTYSAIINAANEAAGYVLHEQSGGVEPGLISRATTHMGTDGRIRRTAQEFVEALPGARAIIEPVASTIKGHSFALAVMAAVTEAAATLANNPNLLGSVDLPWHKATIGMVAEHTRVTTEITRHGTGSQLTPITQPSKSIYGPQLSRIVLPTPS